MSTVSTAARPRRADAGTLARSFGSLLSPRGPRGRLAVFSYHQVLEARDPLRPGEPSLDDFARDVETIAGVFTVLPLEEASRRLREGTLPTRAACVTFDDGYANNHELAAPVLESRGVPATFFITGGAIDDGVMWNDLVIEAVARAEGRLVLEGVHGIDAEAVDGAGGAGLVASLLGALKYQPLGSRLASAEQIYRINVEAEPPRLMMSRAMVADLARRGFDIGGHTLHHPILKELTADEARAEIESCSAWIEEVTGRRPITFAYPNGRPGKDFTEAHAAMVAQAGYEAAVTTEWGIARAGVDRYNLPRIGPWWRQRRSLTGGLLRVYLKSYLA